MPSTARTSLTLRPAPPYDFNLTAAAATYFRNRYGVETFENGLYRRLLYVAGSFCLVSVGSAGSLDSPRLEVEITGKSLDESMVSRAAEQAAWILGIEQDLTPFYRLTRGDSILGPLIRGMRGLHVPRTASVYEGLILAILGQQISSQVARMLRNLIIETYGPALEVCGIAYRGFPRPTDLAKAGVEKLRRLKLGARKANYIWEISEAVASGRLDLEALKNYPDEQVIEILTRIRGIGSWTVQWLLVRSLGREDGFPFSDLALRRTLALMLQRPAPLSLQESLEYSRRWSPCRSYVTTYLFAAMRSGRTFIAL